jgi:hypothetical protein
MDIVTFPLTDLFFKKDFRLTLKLKYFISCFNWNIFVFSGCYEFQLALTTSEEVRIEK